MRKILGFSERTLITAIFALFLAVLLILSLGGCSLGNGIAKADDLGNKVKANKVYGKASDNTFISSGADLSLELFKKSITKGENSLISPTSIWLALAMTANGAEGDTLKEMEAVLGRGISLEELNNYLYSYVAELPSHKKSSLNIANSIWFRDEEERLAVEQSFLQKNSDYYKASIYKADFNSPNTLKDINGWVEDQTKGMIDKIVDKISDNTIMYLINAIAFEAEWSTIYTKNQVMNGTFKGSDGTQEKVDFMHSMEYSYIEDSKVTGFIKPYANDSYSFVALLPEEGLKLEDYIEGLTGEEFLKLINEASTDSVMAVLPKFSYDYKITLNDILAEMGMPSAFDASKANFSALGKASGGSLYISEVLHKSFISVDEKGTKAGAATKVEIKESAVMTNKEVILNRPFIYAIIDNQTKLPVFIGTVQNVK